MRVSEQFLTQWARENLRRQCKQVKDEIAATGSRSVQTEFHRGRLQGLQTVLTIVLGNAEIHSMYDALRQEGALIPTVLQVPRLGGPRQGIDSQTNETPDWP